MYKRGQGLSVNAIILIVLGVFVLAVLIVGFTLGWGTLKDRIIPSNNVDTIANSCAVACSTQSKYDFCTAPRDLKAADAELDSVTCNYLAEKQTKYGIDSCGSVSCDDVVLSAATTIEVAKESCASAKENDVVYYLVNNKLETYTCIEGDISGEKSCTEDSVGGKAVCDADKCTDQISGEFSGVDEGQVCCNVACTS